LNQPMLDLAAEVGTARPVEWRQADAMQLPFEDGSFDAVLCQFGAMFFPDKVCAMREARRVLRPGGRYCFNVWDSLALSPIANVVQETLGAMYPANPPTFLGDTPHSWFDLADIERVVREGGFARCEVEPLTLPCVAPTAEQAARAYVEGTPLFGALAERGVSDFGPVRRAVEKELAARFGARPCSSTMRAIVVTAS
jgi:SAM-dependent methyltransferase